MHKHTLHICSYIPGYISGYIFSTLVHFAAYTTQHAAVELLISNTSIPPCPFRTLLYSPG